VWQSVDFAVRVVAAPISKEQMSRECARNWRVDQCDVGYAPADYFTTQTLTCTSDVAESTRIWKDFFVETGPSFELASPHHFSVRKRTECRLASCLFLSPAVFRIFLYAVYTFLDIFYISLCLPFLFLLLFTDTEQYYKWWNNWKNAKFFKAQW
jgi:hypothetical protein